LSSGNVADEEDGTATAIAATTADSTDKNDATTATARPFTSAADSLAAKKARGRAARKKA